MTQANESILKVMAYFDTFNYPLTIEEISTYLDQPIQPDTLHKALQSLLDKELVWQLGQFYSLRSDPELELKRLNGNKLAVKQLKHAMRISLFLSWFPFIRGIGISGSLSKNLAYKGSDLDFFIITASNRLWIIRTFMLMLVRVFAWLGSRKICLNYFVDEQALEIEEKNIFTAIEVATLLPARGIHSLDSFFSSNHWVFEYLPNIRFKEMPKKEVYTGPLKRSFEWLLDNKLGNNLDNWLLKYFSQRWAKVLVLNKPLPNGFMRGAISIGKHFYKPTPHDFQKNILLKFQERMNKVKAQYVMVADKPATSSLVK